MLRSSSQSSFSPSRALATAHLLSLFIDFFFFFCLFRTFRINGLIQRVASCVSGSLHSAQSFQSSPQCHSAQHPSLFTAE